MHEKNFVYRTLSLLMAFLMLFTSVGYTMSIHYCKGKIESIALFGNIADCDMHTKDQFKDQKEEKTCCEKRQETSEARDACCEKKINQLNESNNHQETVSERCCYNETIVLEGQQGELESKDYIVKNEHTQFAVVFVLTYFNLFDSFVPKVKYLNYKPPLLYSDLMLAHQVFRL